MNGKTKKYKVTSRRVLEKRVLFISYCYWRSSLTKKKRKAFLGPSKAVKKQIWNINEFSVFDSALSRNAVQIFRS